ncbi:hypothetical protein V6251_14475 [Olleya sp. Ti.3.14]|uniref:hypothetical protein n=1 Tax=Olleya sp. Ti.3.14 TaxID=3121297 RepID=UPI00311FF30E
MDNIIRYEVGSNAIQHLLAVSSTIELSYQNLKSETKNDMVKSWIDNKLSFINAFKQQSLSILNTVTVQKPSKPSVLMKLNMLWFNIKRKFYKSDSQIIINECLKLNSYFLNEVNKEIKSGILSKPAYTLLNTLKNELLITKQEFYISKLKLS